MSNSNETIKDMGDNIKAILEGRNKTIADYDTKVGEISNVISAADAALHKLSSTYDTNKKMYESLKIIWMDERKKAEDEVAQLEANLESKKKETAAKLALLESQKQALQKDLGSS